VTPRFFDLVTNTTSGQTIEDLREQPLGPR